MLLRSIYIAFAFLVIGLASAENAHAKKDLDKIFGTPQEYGFSKKNRVDKKELANMRGGLRIGSLNFDFAINTRTVVDGIVQSASVISSANISTIQDVQRLNTDIAEGSPIDAGANSALAVEAIVNSSSIITTIQNNTDNALIQQFNQLDIVVSNITAVRNANMGRQFDIQSTQALR